MVPAEQLIPLPVDTPIGTGRAQVAVGSLSQASAIPETFLGMAVEGPSSEGFLVYPVVHVDPGGPGHATGERPHILPDGKPHDWTLEYVPADEGGKGRMTVSLDGESVAIDVPPSRSPTAARFDRFGIITTWIDGNGQHIYFDDLRYTFEQP